MSLTTTNVQSKIKTLVAEKAKSDSETYKAKVQAEIDRMVAIYSERKDDLSEQYELSKQNLEKCQKKFHIAEQKYLSDKSNNDYKSKYINFSNAKTSSEMECARLNSSLRDSIFAAGRWNSFGIVANAQLG